MNELFSFAAAFTACSFAVLIIYYLTPNGNLKRITSLVLVLFTLISVIKPLKNIKTNKIQTDISLPSEDITDNTASVIKTKIRQLTNEALKANGIDNYELILDISIEENEIVINEYNIRIDDINKSEEIKNAVKEKVGFEPEINELD